MRFELLNASSVIKNGVLRLEEKRESPVCNVRLRQSIRPCDRRAKTLHNLIWGQSALFREIEQKRNAVVAILRRNRLN